MAALHSFDHTHREKLRNEAARAYDTAARELFGEYAQLNFERSR